jgi:hypothetical protein
MKIATLVSLVAAGLLLLHVTLWGTIMALVGIGIPGSLSEAFIEICWVSGFPVYLISFRSLRWASRALWLYFLLQWVSTCIASKPKQFVNPLYWSHGVEVFIATLLVSAAFVALSHNDKGKSDPCLFDAI